jgi:hypothetical protein
MLTAMLQILALLLLAGAAVDIARRVHCHRAVFARLHQTTAIAWLVWLYPLPFFLPLFAKSFFAFLLFRIPIDAVFFVPALISARKNQKCFEKSGDNRVKPAFAVVHTTLCAGIMGIMGVFVLTFYLWIFG